MRQKTAKTQREVYEWIENTPHHKAWVEPMVGEMKFFILQGEGMNFRIPAALHKEIGGKVAPGHHMDRRMFRWVGEVPE